MPANPLVDRAVAALTDLIESANTQRSHPTDEQIALVSAGPRLKAMVDAFVCESVLQADQSNLAQSQGAASIATLIGDKGGADPAIVRADLRFARWLCDFAVLRDAFETGAILREHLHLIRTTVHNARTFHALRHDQQMFVGWAATLDFVDYKHACRYWMLANDPDGAEPADQTATSFFRARRRNDGSVKLDGLLDPLSGATFMTAFEREDQHLFRQQHDNPDPDVYPVEQHSRSNGRRGVTALMNLVCRGANRTSSTAGDPLINIVMSEQVAEDLLRRLAEDDVAANTTDLPLEFDNVDGRCEFIDGTPVHPHFVLATLATATFRRQIMSATGRIIDVSVNARCFNHWQKQALLVQARGRCRRRGCDAPFAWLQADHIQPHSRGGPTSLGNGKILCEPDNHIKGNRTGD